MQQSSPASRPPSRSRTVPCPSPAAGQVLVRIEASGLCHTDIHAAHGDWPVKPTPPFVPGHEGVGIIESLGAGVTNRSVGDRVALPWLGHACGHCDYCISGWETLCESQQNTGYSIDGGLAEFARGRRRLRRPGPRGRQPPRRRAADLRRRHDVQGDQGGRHPAHRTGRGVRRRWPGPPGRAVRRHRRRHRHRRRRGAGQARPGRGARRRPPRQRAGDRPGRRDRAARRGGRRRGAGGDARRSSSRRTRPCGAAAG